MADYDSSLPVRTETDGDVVAKLTDTTGANIWAIDANSIGQVNLNDGTNSLVIDGAGGIAVTPTAGAKMIVWDGTDNMLVNTDGTIGIGDGTEQMLVNVDGSISTQLTDGTDSLAINTDGSLNNVITDGTDTLEVNTDGSINVVVQDEGVSATEIHEYATTAATAPNTPTTVVDYTVSASTTFRIRGWKIAGSGKSKGVLSVGPVGYEVDVDVTFLSTSDGSYESHFDAPIEVAAGDKVLVTMTNRDKSNADLYAWVNGNEIAV